MPGDRVIHLITPGDHFSPRTGSAIPTVVDGLARAAERAGAPRQAVVVDASTWTPRYDSADIVEYSSAPWPKRSDRYIDVLRGRLRMTRSGAVRWYSPLVDVVRTQRPGVVLAHNAPVVPGMLRDCGHKVVLYVHNELLNSYSRAESGRMLNDVDAIVCVSDWLAEKTAQRLPPRLQSRVRTVANGVDTVQFSPHGGRSERDRLRVMFVGRVIPLKGVDVLLHVLALITDTDLDVDIIGSQGFDSEARLSAYEKTLRGLAVKTPHNVHFRPFTERSVLPELLRSADIFVVPSRWSEASGLTVGEAMATGLPIVASRIGGVPEVLGDAGLLVTPDEPTALAAALSSLIGSRARRLKLSAAARTRAEHHDWSRSWRQLRTVLDEV